MKRMILACAAALFLCSTATAQEWYEGGTLHNATVAQYLQGAPANVFATTSDWVSATISDAAIRQLTMDALKRGSADVALCIVNATDGVDAAQQQLASQMAFMCMNQLKASHPWILAR